MLVRGLVHDFNNLLTTIAANAEFALATMEADHPSRRALTQIESASARAIELMDRFSTFGAVQGTTAAAVDLGLLLSEVSALLEVRLTPGSHIEVEAAEDLPLLHGDPLELYQLVFNLGINAARAVENGGSIDMSVHQIVVDGELPTRLGALPEGRYFKLVVEDSGAGMDPAALSRMFQPFFTTKARGGGLGLAITERIVRAHRGGIIVHSQRGAGTAVEIYLPAA